MSRETFSHLSSRISEIFLQTVARAGRIGGDGDGEVDVLALAKRGERVEELLQRLVGAVVEDLVEIVDEEMGDVVIAGVQAAQEAEQHRVAADAVIVGADQPRLIGDIIGQMPALFDADNIALFLFNGFR